MKEKIFRVINLIISILAGISVGISFILGETNILNDDISEAVEFIGSIISAIAGALTVSSKKIFEALG